MDKYLERLNPELLLNREIKAGAQNYTIVRSEIESALGSHWLKITLCDLEEVETDSETEEELEWMLEYGTDADDVDNLSCVDLFIRNPILGDGATYGCISDIDARFSNRGKTSLWDDIFVRRSGYDFHSLDEIKEELGRGGVIGGLRNIFVEIFGEEYSKDLIDNYVNLTKSNLFNITQNEHTSPEKRNEYIERLKELEAGLDELQNPAEKA